MGLFDDLVPAAQPQAAPAAAAPQTGGAFDDLIPTQGAGSTELLGTTPAQGDQPARVVIGTNPRSQSEANTRQVMSGVQGAGRGLADIAGAPVDLATGAINLATRGVNAATGAAHNVIDAIPATEIPLIQKPFLGSDYIADAATRGAEAVGVPVMTPENTKEKFAYNTNRVGANAAATVGALAELPAAVNRVAPQVADTVTNMTAPYVNATGRTIAGDVGASAGAGALQTAGDVAIPDNLKKSWAGPLIEFALTTGGAVGGGTATQLAISGGKGAAGLVQKLLGMNLERNPDVPINPATGKRYTKADVDQVAALLQDKSVNPTQAARNIEEGANYYAGEGGPAPTSGILSNDVGMIGLEKGARVADPVPFIQRDQQINSAAVDKVNKIAPEGADAGAFPRQVRKYGDEQIAGAEDKVNQAQTYADRASEIQGQHGAEVTAYRGRGVDASRELDRNLVENTIRPFDEAKNRRYAEIPNTPVSSEPLYDAAQEVRATARNLPPAARSEVLPTRRLRDFEHYVYVDPETQELRFRNVDYQTVEQLRPIISAEIQKARKENAPPPLIDNLERLRRTIGDYSEQTPQGREANRFYREDYSPVLGPKAGEAYAFRQDLNKDRVQRSASPPSETAGRFIQPEAPEKTASLQRMIDSMPDPAQAQAAARNYMMADLAERGAVDARTGALRPQALRKWSERNAANLDLVPGLRDEVNGLITRAQKGEVVSGRFAEELRNAQTNLKMTERQINSGALGNIMGADPARAVGSIFKSNNPAAAMDQALSAIKNEPAAIDGFKAAVRDYLQENATTSAIGKTTDGSRPVSFAKLDGIFNEHEQTLAKLFSPQEMNDLRAAHKFLAPMQGLSTAAAAGSQTVEKANNEFSKLFRAGLIARYGALKAGGIMKSLKLALESLPSNQQSLESLASQMFFDPKLAAHLLTRDVSSVNSPAWTKGLFRILGTEAAARNEDGER
jgi:hypothetical protein